MKRILSTLFCASALFAFCAQPVQAGLGSWAAKKGAEYAKKKADEHKQAKSKASDTPAKEITTPKDTDVITATVRKSVQMGGGYVLQLSNSSAQSLICEVTHENKLNGKIKTIKAAIPANGMKEIGAVELKSRILDGCNVTVTVDATGETHTYEF